MKKIFLNYTEDKKWDKDGGLDCYESYYTRIILLEENEIHSYNDINKLLSLCGESNILDKISDIEEVKERIVELDNQYEICVEIAPINGTVSVKNAKFFDKDGSISTANQLITLQKEKITLQEERIKYVKQVRKESVEGFMSCVKQLIQVFAYCSTDYFEATHDNLTKLDRIMDINSIIDLVSELKGIMDKQYFSMKKLLEGNYIKAINDYQIYVFDFSSLPRLKINVSIDNLDFNDVVKNDAMAKDLMNELIRTIFSNHLDISSSKNTEQFILEEYQKVEKFVEEFNLPQIEHLRRWINDSEKSSKLVQKGLGYYLISLRPIDWAYLFQDKKFYLWLQKKGTPPRQLGAEYFYE